MKELVEALCARECAGRAMGTPGGIRARGLVRDALREAGLDPAEQAIGRSKGANLVATLPGDVDRWVLVAAHYDHLGSDGRTFFYPGADDNASAVAILVEVARALAPEDTPEHLDWAKMSATARWLARYVRATCAREAISFRNQRDDASTLRSLAALAPQIPEEQLRMALASGQLVSMVEALLG